MLILSRRVGEEIVIAGGIRLTVVAVKARAVRVGITAPPSVKVTRAEICDSHAGRGPAPRIAEAGKVPSAAKFHPPTIA